jgi:3-deoxy-D-manno-octulosonate 8-phosphate phosphatase KdsC-like HAD superfamily phosphatase
VSGTWIFDVDGCLIDSLGGASLRPGTGALLDHLRASGARVLLWSAGGADYARDRMAALSVDDRFHGFFDKDGRDDDGRYLTAFLPDLDGVVFVDDRPEDMPVGADVVAVAPYLAHNRFDRGLRPAWERAGLVLSID